MKVELRIALGIGNELLNGKAPKIRELEKLPELLNNRHVRPNKSEPTKQVIPNELKTETEGSGMSDSESHLTNKQLKRQQRNLVISRCPVCNLGLISDLVRTHVKKEHPDSAYAIRLKKKNKGKVKGKRRGAWLITQGMPRSGSHSDGRHKRR